MKSLIQEYLQNLEKDSKKILNNMQLKEITIDNYTYRIGYVQTPVKYRNELRDIVISQNNPQNIDMVGMFMPSETQISYRDVKPVDISKVAVKFGGKGHKGAASHPSNNKDFLEFSKNIKF